MSWFSRFPSSTFSRRRHFPLGVALVVAISTSLPSLYALSRGDVNDDERVDIADATYLLTHLFLNGPEPKCVPVADMNSDTVVDLSDSIFLLVHLFGGGPAPASLSSSEQSSCGVIAPQPSARGLFFSNEHFELIQSEAAAGREPWASNRRTAINRAEGALSAAPQVYKTDNVLALRFGWCETFDPKAPTLKAQTRLLEQQSSLIRNLALGYAFTGDRRFGDRALVHLLAWAREGTLINMYDFDIDFVSATFRGSTNDGSCGVRPWHFALDAMWQTYGLINLSDAFLLLTRNGYPLSSEDDATLRDFLRRLVEAVNSSFHAWTRWADAHPRSPSYERYRSDNHLSWCLAGIMAGAVALEDDELMEYCLHGGTWVDRKAGAYKNPSPITDVIDRAIESGTGSANEGRFYEEKINRNPPLGYAMFHLWPMSLVLLQAEIHRGEDLWTFKGSDGAGVENAFDRYAGHLLGERSTGGENLQNHRWLWELGFRRFKKDRYRRVILVGPRNQYILQSIGPVAILATDSF